MSVPHESPPAVAPIRWRPNYSTALVKRVLPRPLLGRYAGIRRHAPDDVADIVGDHQRALGVDGDADRPAVGFAVRTEEAGQHVDRHPLRPPIPERHEDHLVAGGRIAVPRTVLADKAAFPQLLR